MFLTPLMTMLSDAVKVTFDQEYPVEEFRGLRVGLEFPFERTDYPGIWVDFQTTGNTRIAGIDHKEWIEADDGSMREVVRWTFSGTVTYTVVSFSSLERHRLVDEMIRVLAFGREQAATNQFRQTIEDNDYVAVNMNFDEIGLRGLSTSQGTPWGGTEFIYEGTLSTDLIGEYVTEPRSAVLVPLSAVQITAYAEHEPDPFEGDQEGWR